jgi:hypothetical protein
MHRTWVMSSVLIRRGRSPRNRRRGDSGSQCISFFGDALSPYAVPPLTRQRKGVGAADAST